MHRNSHKAENVSSIRRKESTLPQKSSNLSTGATKEKNESTKELVKDKKRISVSQKDIASSSTLGSKHSDQDKDIHSTRKKREKPVQEPIGRENVLLPQSSKVNVKSVSKRTSNREDSVTGSKSTVPRENPFSRGTAKAKLVKSSVSTATNNATKSYGISTDVTSDKKERNLKFKGGGVAAESHYDSVSKSGIVSARKNTASNANDSSHRLNAERLTKIVSNSRNLKKVTNEPKLQTKIKASDHKNSEKIATVPTSNRSGSSVNERRTYTSGEKIQNKLPETSKKSGVGHRTSKSDRPASNLGQKNEVTDKKREGSGRERSRTWIISSDKSGETLNQNDGKHEMDRRKMVVENSVSGNGNKVSVKEEENTFGEKVTKPHNQDNLQGGGDAGLASGLVAVSKVLKDESSERSEGENRNVEESKEEFYGDYDYEDDFEDYESDFEECSDEEEELSRKTYTFEGRENVSESESSDSDETEKDGDDTVEEVNLVVSEVGGKENEEEVERKLDSGLYDSGHKRRQESEVTPLKLHRIDADEGFDEREECTGVSKEESERRDHSPRNFDYQIYFPKRTQLTKQEANKVIKRGEQLLEMITLDEVSYSLFDMPPIPYEAFMRCRGHLNTKQASVQTNEDSHSEGVQTSVIPKRDVWTQKPPVLGSSGVAGEDVPLNVMNLSSWKRLARFMESAAEVMTIIMEEQAAHSKTPHKEYLPETVVSKFSVKLGQSSKILESLFAFRPVSSIHFCETQTNLLLCSHSIVKNEVEIDQINASKVITEENELEYLSGLSVLSVWSVNEPSSPLCLLCCQGNVCRTCFGGCSNKYGQFVLAGTDAGVISLWDLHDKGKCFKKIFVEGCSTERMALPIFSTYEVGIHLGRIVGLVPVEDTSFCDKASLIGRREMTNQVCSLDEWGNVVIWSVIGRFVKSLKTYELVPSMQLCLENVNMDNYDQKQNRQEVDLPENSFVGVYIPEYMVWNSLAVDHNWIVAASDSGIVICIPLDRSSKSTQIFPGSKVFKFSDSYASAECIAKNPQGLPYFLVGNSTGKVYLHSYNSVKCFGSWTPPLVTPESAVRSIAWSSQRPFLFFTLDTSSRINVWDLARSDMFPVTTIPPPKDGNITALSLSYYKGNAPAYMAVGMDHGQIILHHLKEDFGSKNEMVRKKEIAQFLKYANHL